MSKRYFLRAFFLYSFLILQGCGFSINKCKEKALEFPLQEQVQFSGFNILACEWPKEYPGSDDPGSGYKESQVVAEDADCYEDG